MPSRKNLIAIGGLPVILGLLYLEQWIGYWVHAPGFTQFISGLFLLTALFGGWLWAINLPHPRQERKRREALLKAEQDLDARTIYDEKETLAEKPP